MALSFGLDGLGAQPLRPSSGAAMCKDQIKMVQLHVRHRW